MNPIKSFRDGLYSLVNSLANSRNPIATEEYQTFKLSQTTLRALYRTGLGNKIVSKKSGPALKNTIQFSSVADEDFYNKRLAKLIKQASKWMIGMGRGVIVLYYNGDDLATTLGNNIDPDVVQIRVFGGDMITVGDVDLDFMSPRYYKPKIYSIRGYPVHWTRVIDFTYVQPPEMDSPQFFYGGMSEFELIYDQLIADGITQRASPRILQKASTLFYKVAGFKDAMVENRESEIVQYFTKMEDIRGLFSSGLIDKEDELEVITQSITNLADADQITLRRLAMVTSIPLTELVGESARGFNSSGENERVSYQEMLETVQSDYLYEPINLLMRKLSKGEIWFKENQGQTPESRINYEQTAIANAKSLYEMGEDHTAYLEDKGVITKDDFKDMFDNES